MDNTQTDKRTDTATYRLNQPSGREVKRLNMKRTGDRAEVEVWDWRIDVAECSAGF